MKIRIVELCLCVASLTPLLAHDLYILPDRFHFKPGQGLTVELHNGDAFPESEGPPATQRLRDTRMLGKQCRVDLKNFQEDHKALVTSVSTGDMATGSLIITPPSARTLASMMRRNSRLTWRTRN